MYTVKDLVFSKSSKTTRKWNHTNGEWEYDNEASLDVSTSDGLFKSYTDSDGYSYWQDNTITYGNHGTDYFFITEDFPYVEKYQQDAVDLLNRLAF
jgi:hypothetical protein